MTIPKFDEVNLEHIARELGESIIGGQLSQIFKSIGIIDNSGESTKWRRIYHSLLERQNQDRCGNYVAVVIEKIMNPISFETLEDFENARVSLNKKLLFSGLEVNKKGKVVAVRAATTISEAEQRACNLRQKLSERGIHGDVLTFCRAEYLDQNYFHCILEASKSLAHKIRDKSQVDGDGGQLVDTVFSINKPRLALNSLRTETEQSDQKGFANLLRGIFGSFRNPAAHNPKIYWAINEKDALDALTIISYAHRRLDQCAVVPVYSE